MSDPNVKMVPREREDLYQRSGGTHTAAIAPPATVTGQLEEERHAPDVREVVHRDGRRRSAGRCAGQAAPRTPGQAQQISPGHEGCRPRPGSLAPALTDEPACTGGERAIDAPTEGLPGRAHHTLERQSNRHVWLHRVTASAGEPPASRGGGHRPHRRRRRRTRPGPAGPGPEHRRGAARPAGGTPAAGRAGPGVPGLLHPAAAARFLNPAAGAGLGRLAGPGDTSAARSANGPATPATRSATLTTTPVPLRAPGQFRKLDATTGTSAQHSVLITRW